MAAIVRMDELVKDYLLYRGLTATLRQLEIELKNEKDKGFRVNRIVDQLQSFVTNYELISLREYWAYLEQRIFSRLEQVYSNSVRKLEVSLLKYYVVNAVQTGRQDKVNEFFEKLANDLQHNPEWKEWFVLPFIRTPEESNTFAVYLTRQWQETFLVSLHNFFSVIFQSMPVPALLNFEDDSRRLTRLQEENALYRAQIGRTLERRDVELVLRQVETLEVGQHVSGGGQGGGMGGGLGPVSMDLMDDFFVISHEVRVEQQQAMMGTLEVLKRVVEYGDTIMHEQEEPEPKTNQIRSFIKNIGLPTSPIVGKKSVQQAPLPKKPASKDDSQSSQNRSKVKDASSKVKGKVGSAAAGVASGQQQQGSAGSQEVDKGQRSDAGSHVKVKEKTEPVAKVTETKAEVTDNSQSDVTETRPEATKMPTSFVTSAEPTRPSAGVAADVPDGGGLLLLSQEEYAEHRSPIIQCRFSHQGHCVATSDVDGVVKVWGLQPSPVTMATIMSKSMLLSLEWAENKDRLLLLGNKAASVRLFDVKEKKTVKEATVDPNFPRVISISSNPCGPSFAVSAAVRGRGGGKLSIWDLASMKSKQNLALAPAPTAVNYITHNRQGQLLLTGAADGIIRLFDVRQVECVASWTAHSGDVYTTLFTPDEGACYSMGADGKLSRWSLARPGCKVADLSIHPGAAGPFVLTGAAGYRQVQTAKGKLFAQDRSGEYILTCAQNGGLVYRVSSDVTMLRLLTLGGHNTPVVSVDWSAAEDCRVCLTGAMDGRVRVSTLLSQ